MATGDVCVRLVSGRADALSGRYFLATRTFDEIVGRPAAILKDDLMPLCYGRSGRYTPAHGWTSRPGSQGHRASLGCIAAGEKDIDGFPTPGPRLLAMVLAMIIMSLLSDVEAASDAKDKEGAAMPIALHPDNPHYFLFRGKPAVLITSGEHYGAVLNSAFDYAAYLDEVKACGLNLTRTFSGVYMESPASFGIAKNTLAPAEGKLLCPWARSRVAGYAAGGNKFDLTRFDPAYFRRLKDFVSNASDRGIVVELVLFCPFYKEEMWDLSPMNARNNVNGIGQIARTDALTLKNGALLDIQLALVRRIIEELKDADNVYYEICNEPYFGGVTMDWQHHIAETIVEAEKGFPARHLIAQNIANGTAQIRDPHPAVSIFNFHYATPPDAVAQNFGLNKPIADDETGFKGTADAHYRREGWEFILAGGAVYSNIDYSFTVEHPRGTFQFPPKQPGGGGPALRTQLGILKRFIEGFDFIRMRPFGEAVQGGVPAGASVRVLADPGRAYAVCLHGGKQATLALELPAATYEVEWIDTLTGAVDKSLRLEHAGGRAEVISPPYEEDIALRIVKLP